MFKGLTLFSFFIFFKKRTFYHLFYILTEVSPLSSPPVAPTSHLPLLCLNSERDGPPMGVNKASTSRGGRSKPPPHLLRSRLGEVIHHGEGTGFQICSPFLVSVSPSPMEACHTTQPFTLHMHPAEASSSLKKIHHRGGPLLQRGSPFPPCF